MQSWVEAKIIMSYPEQEWLHCEVEATIDSSLLNETTLNAMPHAAIVINKNKTIIAANRIAREMGAIPGKDCANEFCAASRAIRCNSLHSQFGRTGQVHSAAANSFCLAEKALLHKEVMGRHEIPFLSRLWDVWWIPLSGDLLLHYWIDTGGSEEARKLLTRNERVKALGEMALGMAHNFNNTLQVIVSGARLGLLEAGTGNLPEVQNCLQKILSIALVGADTLRSLIDFGRQTQDSPYVRSKVFDLSKTIARTVSLCDFYWKAGEEDQTIRTSVDLDLTDDCFIRGNETEMFEVLMNMIKNSAEALPQGGRITITTFVKNDQAILEVSDTGVGIPEDQLTKIFEPFWTTKGLQGTGVGLAACHGIVRRHGGDMSVKSQVGKGTTFRVALPLEGTTDVIEGDGKVEIADLRLRILLIDDIPELVMLLQEALELSGHTVLTAFSGRDGLQSILNDRDTFDVVMCDIEMGDLNGWEVARGVKTHCEKVGLPKPVVFLLTGFGTHAAEDKNIEEWGVDCIAQKPVDVVDLMGKVGQIICNTMPKNRV